MPTSPKWYELRDLVAGKKFEGAAVLLAREPSLRSAVNGLGETVLHYQAVENDEEGVAWLSSQGFDINIRNELGTPVVFEVAQLWLQIGRGGSVHMLGVNTKSVAVVLAFCCGALMGARISQRKPAR